MIVSVVLGGLVGIEREWSNHAAGFRTHILVCLGSATIMMLSMYGFSQFVNETNVRMDPARLAAQVISGIGFLGAGAILRNGNMIKGLTTAASVWVVAAIGLCTGAGFMLGASVCTLLVLISLFLLNKWEKHWLKDRRIHDLDIQIYDKPGVLGKIASKFGEYGIQITNLKMIHQESPVTDSDELQTMHLHFSLKGNTSDKFHALIEEIACMEVVISIESNQIASVNRGSKEKYLTA
ncbi:MgtC/SapB family protein [Paenibacillus sp. LHD-38]|uniref:MgtC/SapB family protein n=1 Tax=Paenibacillus sp. LHD-38 TaxID=3072143 RepID=UPI00280E67E3|nr:MgtC/SapB family protein [Paenibacillus sp. LHD-38]MDQ8734710.1 MgtC/SapB family protein [Paenibacillus sp. LHD-38]